MIEMETYSKVSSVILEINNYLSSQSTINFIFTVINGYQVVLAGSTGLNPFNPDFEIEFNRPFYVSSFFSWNIVTTQEFIKLANEFETNKTISELNVGKGNLVFKLNEDDNAGQKITIVARDITFRVLPKIHTT